MSLLRATVRSKKDWWEAKLLDLNIVVDGESETALLRQLEHTLTAEYHLAIRFGQTPFVNLLLNCPDEVANAWEDDNKRLRTLNLPSDVRLALSTVFRKPKISEFKLDVANSCQAKVA